MINKVILVGHVGADPETRTFANGGKVCNFSVATEEKWKDKHSGENKSHTEWHRVAVFGPLADVAENYVRKGKKVYVEGKMKTRSWEDQSGQKRYSTEVVLQGFNSVLQLLSKREEEAPQNTYAKEYAAEQSPNNPVDDEIPF
jgi:single-strand DNA-binding protein